MSASGPNADISSPERLPTITRPRHSTVDLSTKRIKIDRLGQKRVRAGFRAYCQ
jgi:hypothetical protein